MPNLPLVAGTLPYSCYPATPQALINDAFALGVAVQATTLTGVIIQDATPALSDRDKLWIRTSGGAPVTPLGWIFFNGSWMAKHPVPPSTQWGHIYTGTLASIDTLDGSSAGVVTDNTGPFWELVSAMAAMSPIGAGTLPSGKVLAVTDTGGEEKHVLSELEIPAHDHPRNKDGNTEEVVITTVSAGTVESGPAALSPFASGHAANYNTTGKSNSGNPAIEHNNLHPYYTVFFLRRTARIYCTTPMA